MLDRMPHPKAPLLVPDAGERDSVRWDGWRVVFPTDAEYAEEYAAARHEQRAYGQPLRYATEGDIAFEVARRAARATA